MLKAILAGALLVASQVAKAETCKEYNIRLGNTNYTCSDEPSGEKPVEEPLPANVLEIKGVTTDRFFDCDEAVKIYLPQVTAVSFHRECSTKHGGQYANPMLSFKTGFLDGEAGMFVRRNAAGLVDHISVSRFDFEKARIAFQAKYGTGQVQEGTIQNRAGAIFPQTVITWEQGNQTLRLSRHGSRIGEPNLYLSGKLAKQRHEQSKKPSGNI